MKKFKKTIQSVIKIGDVINAEVLGVVDMYKVEMIEVGLNNENVRPTDLIIKLKLSFNDGKSTLTCTSNDITYIRHTVTVIDDDANVFGEQLEELPKNKILVMQWLGENSFDELYDFANANENNPCVGMENGRSDIAEVIVEGNLVKVYVGDYIIKDSDGSLKVVKDINLYMSILKEIFESLNNGQTIDINTGYYSLLKNIFMPEENIKTICYIDEGNDTYTDVRIYNRELSSTELNSLIEDGYTYQFYKSEQDLINFGLTEIVKIIKETDVLAAEILKNQKETERILSKPSAHSLVECLEELKFGRPRHEQLFIKECINRFNSENN